MTTLLILIVFAAIGYWLYSRSRTGDAHTIDISHLPEQFVVFDLETTGLDASKHQIIQIGAIRVNSNSNRHEQYQRLITDNRNPPTQIVELTVIHEVLLK